MIELLFVWAIVAQSGDRFVINRSYDWKLLAETTNCKATAIQLGYKPEQYRCIKK